MRFWDSSAIVPLVLRAPGTASVDALVAADPDLALWWCTPVECAGALCRLARSGGLDLRQQRIASDTLDRVLGTGTQILPTEALRARARRLLAVHPLRSADALQLAAALAWSRERPAGAGFVSLDDRLRAAALAEGFDVLPAEVP